MLNLTTWGEAIMSARLKINSGSTIKGSSFFNMVRISSNLFNKETAEAGMHIRAYPFGTVYPAYNALDKYGVSDYIPVKGQDIITNARSGSSGVGSINVYDFNKNLLRTIYNNTQYTYQKGDYFIRVAFYPYQTGLVNYGHSLLPFEDYYAPTSHNGSNESEESLIDQIDRMYGVAALSWIDDDFIYQNQAYSVVYDEVHDWCINHNIRFDFAFIPYTTYFTNYITVRKAKDWLSEGFGMLFHPVHSGWYDDPYGSFSRDNSVIRNHIESGISKIKELGLPKPKILVYPGNSHKSDETINIVKDYFECGVCWDNQLLSNHLADNDRYRLRRLDIQLSETNTKTKIKNAVREAIENGDWVILGGHIYHFTVSDVLDETTRSTANLFDIISYANSLCQLRLSEDVWMERKILFDIHESN